MYEYTWYQWLSFFYIYCFFGWIFESAYVSLKQRRFVNRGFLRLPMLPLYGTGAVMMLWVSLPFKSNLIMVYISGVIAATILEYVTGWGMERLFKMKYWDYSNQHFNLNGYICLSSSVAWGFLTIFLTEVIHKPIERWVLHVPTMIGIPCLSVITVIFIIDTAESVRTALDLAKVLDAMTKMKTELDDVQVQLALLKAETEQKLEAAKEDTAVKLETLRVEAAGKAAKLRDETVEKAVQLKYETVERAAKLRYETTLKAAQLKEQTSEKAALLKAHADEKAAQYREEAAAKIEAAKNVKAAMAASRSERIAAMNSRMAELTQKHQDLLKHMNFYHKSILRGNPSASSARFAAALKELRETAENNKKK